VSINLKMTVKSDFNLCERLKPWYNS